MNIHCYAASAAKKTLEKFQYTPSDLNSKEVEIDITHCGICHSDIHLIDNDWGISNYPLVPGHEIVGQINAIGSEVREFNIGQRVGVGWQRSSCLHCECCLRGQENLCEANEATCVGHYGGFAEKIRIDSRFVFEIPEELTSENAAPLLCGGITVYSPLRHYDVSPPMRVGVIGIGGLGHLALQYARAFGCEVTAFSSTPGKEEEARKFGAHRFVSSTDSSRFKEYAGSIDFLLSTVFADLEWSAYLQLLRPNGKLCFVGVPPGEIHVPIFALIGGQKSLCGSVIGGRSTIREMLTFSARHGIEAQTEVKPMAEANQALEKVRTNKARYRMVLTN